MQFSGARLENPLAFDEREWDNALAFCDRHQLTLFLGQAAADALPESVRVRIDGNIRSNSQRLERIKADVFAVSEALRKVQAGHVVLKGLSQWPRYVPDLRLRVQYDLDLFCPGDSLWRARDVLAEMGYETAEDLERLPLDHLPAMIRRSGWRWRGDSYDPEIPVAVELHFRFWDEKTERFGAPGIEHFWARRTELAIDGRSIPVLDPVDGLGYTALHLLRHLLRGSLRLCHVYELAAFLHANADDQTFWEDWRGCHAPELQQIEAIAFRLAAQWFGCRLSPVAASAIESLPPEVRWWFARYAASPVEGLFQPNKDELSLHVCLVEGFGDVLSVVRRRLLPVTMPGGTTPAEVPESERTARVVWETRLRYASHVVSRAFHHARTLPPALWRTARCLAETREPGVGFWQFLGAASLFHLGVFIFVVLYNLYLLDHGYREDFLGLIGSAAAIGSLAGALPSGWLAQRLGGKRAMMLGFGATAAISTLRSVVTEPSLLIAGAFLAGAVAPLWFVVIAPIVTGLSTERRRPLGFSLFFSAGIATGILGGFLGGHLPGWIRTATTIAGAAPPKQAALLAACALCALAVWPASRLSLPAAAPRESTTYPWNPFVARFLVALSAWSFAVGAFNPLFSAYFARFLRASEAQIGNAFSASQVAQVGAVLLAPAVLGRLGIVRGVAAMQVAAALALACLSAGPPVVAAGAVYAAWMSFQSMCEPGTYSLLMSGVQPGQRHGASALNFFVIFASQAAAAYLAGAAVTRFGYPVLLASAAAVAGLAALVFRFLLRNFEPENK